MNWEALSRQLIRALRGHRSRSGVSKRLGYSSNVVCSWESGRRWPKAAEFFRLAQRVGVDCTKATAQFRQAPTDWLDHENLAEPHTVARLLTELRGAARIGDLAQRTGRSRFSVSRWLTGQTQPSLPEFLRLIEALTLRAVDFVACFADPSAIPAAQKAWRRLEASRRIARDLPHSQAILRALELDDYQSLSTHQPGWLATRLGMTQEQETEALLVLRKAGEIALVKGRFVIVPQVTDTRRDPQAGKNMRMWCTNKSLAHIEAGAEGLFSYNIFTVSKADLERIRELHLAYFQELRAMVSGSKQNETVVVANIHLFPIA